jgi:hypothetical protein
MSIERRRNLQPVEPEVKSGEEVDLSKVNIHSTDVAYLKRVAFKINDLRNSRKNRYLTEHQLGISIKGMFEEISDQFKIELKKSSLEVDKLIREEANTYWTAYKDIQDVVKGPKSNPWLNITRTMVMLAAVILVVGGALISAPFRTLLHQNAVYIVVVAIVAVVAYVYFDKQK